jgi:KaiC/GvpD/RAD55 family RecA-like ATPase
MKTGKEEANTGIAGLDDVLAGGFTRGHTYLVEGTPGTGKTTLGLQFLREGARHHEPCLHVTLAETAAELRTTAASHGWSLDGIELFERHRQVKAFQMYIIKPLVRNLPDDLRFWQASSGGEFNVRFVNLTMPSRARAGVGEASV